MPLTPLERQLFDALWSCNPILAVAAKGIVIMGPIVDKARKEAKAALKAGWEKDT